MSANDIETVQNWIKGIINDPLSKILLDNSQLTKIQLETLLIDILADRILDKKFNYTKKSMMRISHKKISRGAFNRTLQQARKNMIRSIMTVLLLGYLGILETPKLSIFLEMSNKLENYIHEYSKFRTRSKRDLEYENFSKTLMILKENLKNELNNLITPKKNSIQ